MYFFTDKLVFSKCNYFCTNASLRDEDGDRRKKWLCNKLKRPANVPAYCSALIAAKRIAKYDMIVLGVFSSPHA
jgi:hypothetical protein